MALDTQPRLTHPDDFYEALIDMHRDLDDAQSQAANAQLILLLANQCGRAGQRRQSSRLTTPRTRRERRKMRYTTTICEIFCAACCNGARNFFSISAADVRLA